MPYKKIHVITHRGLDPDRQDSPNGFPTESSKEAFQEHLNYGFGLEFDVNFTKDSQVVIFHDAGLKRISGGESESLFVDLTAEEVRQLVLGQNNHFCFLQELLPWLRQNPVAISALHLKGKFQSSKYLDILVDFLSAFSDVFDRLIIFDVKIETAKYLKERLPRLSLAPSVAHDYDIERFNQCVSGTLLSVAEVLANKQLFSWVWLDEWDLVDRNDGQKKFYTKEVLENFKKEGFKIALVTPELHGTSPGLLGGEAHPDAVTSRLFQRIEEIISLEPDALCTDHPSRVRQMY